MTESAGIFFSEHDAGGGRPPLVLIHGAGGSRLHWPPELRRLEGERVYGLDLPGHGRSPGEGNDTIRGYVERICTWMDALHLEAAVLVGHSMGGAIALTMALDEVTRVRGLILVGTGGRLRVHPTILALTANQESFGAAIDQVVAFAFSSQASPRVVELARARMAETQPRVLHGDFLACDRFDVMDRLGEIDVPTLVVVGVEDRLTPEKYSLYLTNAIPDARMHSIRGAGHMVMIEKPKQVTKVVKAFMNEVYGSSHD